MTPSRRGPRIRIFRWLNHLYTVRLTDTGRALFWVLIASSMFGNVSYVLKVYFLFCLVSCLFLVCVVMARAARVPLSVDAQIPQRSTCGARVPVEIRVTNPTGRAALDTAIREGDLPRHVWFHPRWGLPLPDVAPRSEVTVTAELEFRRRGHYLLPGIQQLTHFPLGIWRDVRHLRRPRSLLVYPKFHPLISLDIPVGKRYQPGGIALSSYLGDSTEFISTREFREGDSLRNIHWRSWARLGKPVVKECHEEYFCRIALLLDTFVLEDPKERYRREFEAAISVAAAVADRLSKEEYVIDVFAAGPEIYYFQAGRSLAYLENVLDILACIEPCHEAPFEKITPLLLDELATITTTIFVVLDWDESREQMVRAIREAGSAAKVIMVRDSGPTLDPAGAESLTGPVVRLKAEDVERGVEDL
jgi:uncharacterized protein (DUF58 family)